MGKVMGKAKSADAEHRLDPSKKRVEEMNRNLHLQAHCA